MTPSLASSYPEVSAATTTEDRVLDAVQRCWERFGFAKVTIDDIANESGVSRATLYRLFPGGRDVLFEALRARHVSEFFSDLESAVEPCATLEDIIVTSIVFATKELRSDELLAALLATEPGEALGQLTVSGLPRIINVANRTLAPIVETYLPTVAARRLIDILVRLTISYFLAPSPDVDLGDPFVAAEFVRPFLTLLESTHRADQPALVVTADIASSAVLNVHLNKTKVPT